MTEAEIMTGNVKDIVNRLSRDMTNHRVPFSIPEAKKPPPQLFVGTHTYIAQEKDELSFGAGDVIEFLEEIEDGWSRGRLKSSGAVGMYPTNFVVSKVPVVSASQPSTVRPKPPTEISIRKEEPKANDRTPSMVGDAAIAPSTTSATVQPISDAETPKTKEMARIKFIYDPRQPDELGLQDLDVLLNILSKDTGEAGWFEGELNGKKGVFPDNFVELVQVPLSTTSGMTFASVSQTRSATTSTAKPPLANPPPPAVPAKPTKPKISDSSTSSGSSAFAALKEKMETGLIVVGPGKVAAVQRREEKEPQEVVAVLRPASTGNSAEPPGVDWNSDDQLSQLQHVTKSRARPPSKRPASMLMIRKKSSESTGDDTSTGSPSSLSVAQNLSKSMFSTGPTASNSTHAAGTHIAPQVTSTATAQINLKQNTSYNTPPPSSTKPVLRPFVSSTSNHSDNEVSPSKTVDPRKEEFVRREEFEALQIRLAALEAVVAKLTR